MELLKVSPAKIQPSPFNPRKHSDKSFMLELTADVAARGVLQPLLVRQLSAEKYELIFGHQRHAAAKAAGLTEVPVLVREATDAEARVLQLVENLKRSDLSPIEIGEGYLELKKQDGLGAQEIAEKVGRSAQSVRDALKLTDLQAEGRQALAEGVLPARTALLIARVNPPAQQTKALKEIIDGRYGRGGPMTVADATEWIAEHYQVDLRLAVFDRTDEALGSPRFGVHPGSCDACPKRYAPDGEHVTAGKKAKKNGTHVRTDGVCTDPACFHDKTRQHAELEAAKLGVKVLAAKATEKLFWNGRFDSGNNDYVEAAAASHDAGAGDRTYKQLLTKEAAAPITAIAISPKGELVELLERDGLKAALKASGKLKKERASSSASAEKEKARAKRDKELELLRKATTAAAMGAVVAKLEAKGFNKKLLRHWADLVDQDATASERRWPSDAPVPTRHSVKQQLDKMNEAQLLAYCFEGSLGWQLRQTFGGYASSMKTLCEFAGVDLKKHEAEQKAALAAAAEKEAA